MLRILFLCTGNSCRSQMAEGWARHLKPGRIAAYSAGIEPHGLDPHAVRVMAEAGVDISGQRSKHVDELRGLAFDYVVTVCDHANDQCPLFPGPTQRIHVGFDDPPRLAATDDDRLAPYRRVRDEIRRFVEGLPESLPAAKSPTCCCGHPAPSQGPAPAQRPSWIVGSLSTAIGEIPRVSTRLCLGDRLGSWKMRWAMGRMRYRIEPGLYAVGNPTPESPVLVSANYKMSFDRLRSNVDGLDAWILILETDGINVWCAAGKGTFGTEELVARIEATRLSDLVAHQRLIVPQLGAPGIAAHEVRQRSGFQVVYGPVRAGDLPAFFAAGMKATPEMREVRFPLGDRVALIPLELVQAVPYVLMFAVCLLLLSGLGRDGYALARVVEVGIWSAVAFIAASCAGVALAPALLPWLPGRALALKGLWVGLAADLAIVAGCWLRPGLLGGAVGLAGLCLAVPAATSFLAMNFTGATTYTSLSGVRREMRAWVPVQFVTAVLGALLWVVGRFF